MKCYICLKLAFYQEVGLHPNQIIYFQYNYNVLKKSNCQIPRVNICGGEGEGWGALCAIRLCN